MIGRVCDYNRCSAKATLVLELVPSKRNYRSPAPQDYCIDHAIERLRGFNGLGWIQMCFSRIEEEST